MRDTQKYADVLGLVSLPPSYRISDKESCHLWILGSIFVSPHTEQRRKATDFRIQHPAIVAARATVQFSRDLACP